MSISKTFATGYQVIIDTKVNSQSAASNNSNVTVAVKLKSLGSSWTINSSASKSGSVTINGTKYDFTFTAALSGNQTKTVYTKTVNIPHGDDGKKTLSLAASLGVNVTISGTSQTTWTVSGSETLPTIARASTLGAISDFTLTSAFNVVVTKKNTDYYDTLVIKVGSTTIKTIAGIANGTTSVTFTSTELNNIYKALPNVTKGTLTFTLTTKTSSSGSNVGTASRTATGTIPSTVKPSISSVALAETVSGLASKFGAYIKGRSKIKGTITATAGTGSTIASYKTVINGSTYNETTNSFTTGALKTAGSNSFTVTVTDKRGRTATYNGTFSVLDYTPPKITTLTVKRASLSGSTYTEDDEGTYAKVVINSAITSLNSKNDKTFTLGYRLANSTGDFTNVTVPQTAYTLNTTVYVAGMNADNAYEFKLTATDYFDAESKTVNLGSSFTLINFNASGHALAFGGVSDVDNSFQVKLPRTDLSTNVYMTGNKTDNAEKNLYFTAKEDAENPHNCKLYGGNGNSETSIGMWDSGLNKLIYRYLTKDRSFQFGADVEVLRNNLPFLIEAVKNIGDNTGRYQISDGLLLQWGKVSITPSAANTPEKLTVTFPIAYTQRPNILIIPQTSAPQNMSTSIGQGSTAVTSFDIYLSRTTATATSIQWLAIGVKE